MNKQQWLKILLVAFFVGAIGSMIVGRFFIPYLATFPGFSSLNQLVSNSPIVINRREEVQLNEGVNLMELTRQSGNVTVNILTSDGNFLGNGIIITSDGMIFTSKSVVKDNKEVRAVFNNGQVLPALVRAADPKSDLLVLTVQATGLTVAQFDEAKNLRAGQRIFTLGRSNEEFVHRFATGFVTNPISNSGNLETVRSSEVFTENLGTDQIFDPELLGGPVFNLQGRVVGMVAGNDQYILAENMQTAYSVYLGTGKITRSYLGLRYTTLATSAATFLGLNRGGIGVLGVEKGSPAEKAGLQVNDLLIEADGKDLSAESFEQILNHYAPGPLKLKLIRGGNTIETTAELIAR